MATNIIKQISAGAKQIRKKHPSMKWTNAIKQASKELKDSKRSTAKKSGRIPKKKKAARKRKVHQNGSSHTKRDQKRKASAPGKRLSRSKKVYYEYRKNRTDMPGKLSGTGTSAYNEMILRRMRENNYNLSLAEKTLVALKDKHKWLKPGGEKKVMAANIKKHKKYIASIKADTRILKRLIV